MQCEICKKNEANVHFKQVFNGEVKEISICEECAAQHGFDPHSPMGISDFLFGVAGQPSVSQEADGKSCPICHMSGSDFRKTSRLGCAGCYETFAEELRPMLTSMHRGDHHFGKVPVGEKRSAEIASLTRTLEEAVATQDFEEAAKLRDRLRELDPSRAAPVKGTEEILQ
jgi:protein arginine kinase activator